MLSCVFACELFVLLICISSLLFFEYKERELRILHVYV